MTYVYEELSTTNIAQRLYADKNAGWSYEGALALAEYIQDYAGQSGKPYELDIVALRCEYSEYADLAAFNDENGFTYETIDDLENDTTVIRLDNGGIIVADF